MSRMLEILAPAGDAACLDAALRAGADAIYFGVDVGFNARARAENLAIENLSSIMDTIHDYGRRGYLTLNTLVFDHELANVATLIARAADAGVDAVIVQDLAVARLVKQLAPGLRLHASTQSTCTDLAAIRYWAELGAERVTLARELSLEQISGLVNASPIELEVFVHGALCVAYSGQCLTSEAIGGRSANRGACAQACRLPYALVVDGVLHDAGDVAYLLSPKDLDASQILPDLVASGVRAIKIEGRLKGPEYVAATTRLYRRLLDATLARSSAATARADVDSTRADSVPTSSSQFQTDPDATSTELLRLHELSTQTFSRGPSPGFLRGTDHQRLVEGTSCDHLGIALGRCLGVQRESGKSWLRLHTTAPLARGDGILVQGKRAGADELGGRVWSLRVSSRDVESTEPRDEVWVWLGPDRTVSGDFSARRVFRTSLAQSTSELDALIPKEPKRVDVRASLSGALGENPRLRMQTADGRQTEITVDQRLQVAQRQPLEPSTVREKLERLGDTHYRLSELDVEIPNGAMLPISALNRARREATDALRAQAHRSVPCSALDIEPNWPTQPVPDSGLFVTCRTKEQAEAAILAGAQGIYLDFLALTGTGPVLRELKGRHAASIGIALPRIRKPGEEKIDAYVRGLEPDAILVRSFGSLADPNVASATHADVAATHRPTRIGDFSLNTSNTLSALELLGRSLSVFTPGYDLDAAQLLALLDSPLAAYAEVVVYHPMPLFHMEHCVFAALLSSGHDHRDCGRPCEKHVVSLRDRKGVELPLEADVGCRNTVFHGIAQSAAEVVPNLMQRGVRRLRIELVRETPEQTDTIVRAHLDLMAKRSSTSELQKRLAAQGLNMVRGSLRVVG